MNRIAILGAGISGLTLGKALRERDLAYDCFEASPVIGGNWAFGNPNGMSSAYRSLHIDTSKEKIQFDDFPMPASYPTFPHHSHVLEYFESVADHFGLRESIHLETKVERAWPTEGGGWNLQTAEGVVRYEHLAVATGHHWDPRRPDFADDFTGDVLHSHDYIDPFEPLDMRGRRILVVGIGNSAVDIASELSHRSLAARLVVSTRRGAHVIPKYLFGKPVDQVVETLPWLPFGLQRKAAAWLLRRVVGRVEDFGLPTPDHALLSAHPTVSSDFLQRVGNGDIEVRGDIAGIEGRDVRFVDGRPETFDVLLTATGYNISFPFFDPDLIAAPDNHLPLFKRVFHPDHAGLLFIGFAQAIPSLIQFVQDQSRWVAEYLAGDYALPTRREMIQAIARDERKQVSHYVPSARHTMQVDRQIYAWDLASERRRGRRRARRQQAGG